MILGTALKWIIYFFGYFILGNILIRPMKNYFAPPRTDNEEILMEIYIWLFPLFFPLLCLKYFIFRKKVSEDNDIVSIIERAKSPRDY